MTRLCRCLQGVKEVTLLGQNVNSYVDNSEVSNIAGGAIPDSSEPAAKSPESAAATQQRSRGFSAVYRQKRGVRRFAQLLDAVARISPELRVRFTSPHPKDFPDEVLDVIGAHANVCKSLHLPAQSGSSAVLERMRRGYSRDAYLELVAHIRRRLPGVALTSDFIAVSLQSSFPHRSPLLVCRSSSVNIPACFFCRDSVARRMQSTRRASVCSSRSTTTSSTRFHSVSERCRSFLKLLNAR